MKQNKCSAWLTGMLFPPKCPACGAFLRRHAFDVERGIFCERCAEAWRRSRFERCGRCGLEYALCRCLPADLARLDLMGSVKLLPYEKVRETVGKRCILFMKKRNNRAVFRFFGRELAKVLRSAYPEQIGDGLVVTNLPRSRTSVNRFGFDQSKLLAKEVARELGAPTVSVFGRKRWGRKEQKHLHASERRKNMRHAFFLVRGALPLVTNARMLILVDDVVTTGASMAGCLSLLPEEVRHQCVCASIGATPLSQKRKK